ncbi:NaeI family type II restriction endonuclease [Streptomyces hokutonensis]|uniref:NaeI family type II restriction endonuclease n=1 Tax=Streptomyces hokutonensis TaxID=1306990 RepID=UPI0036C0AF98
MSPLDDDIRAATALALWSTEEDSPGTDDELTKVIEHIRSLPHSKLRFAKVLRNTIDQLLDGENTGRYDWNSLYKTERTHAGTLVEINLQREFKFADGDPMDYRIRGIDVDCKYSQKFGSWMIPPEALGHLCLLVWADDSKSRWRAGIMRIRQEWLNSGSNRDQKSTIASSHRDKIQWLWPENECELPENVLLHLPPDDVKAVFTPTSGQERLNELFRRAQRRVISRNVVRTVAQQKDYMKRVRGNGGARSALAREGILIMGDYEKHRRVAEQLGLPVPSDGEFISARVVRARAHNAHQKQVELSGESWVLAQANDAIEVGPSLPDHRSTSA